MIASPSPTRRALYQDLGFAAGVAAAAGIALFLRPEGLPMAGVWVAAIGALMAIWWASEAAPVAVTALIPLIAFPLTGAASMTEAAAPYANPVIYLFLGGFVVAIAVERSGLHRRIALTIFRSAVGDGRMLILAFMLAAAFVSMWISNTSTTLMLLPIALSIITVIDETATELSSVERRNFAVSMMLALAYGATLGGMATLIGTPPNAFMAGFLKEQFDLEIDFARWLLVGGLVSAILLPLTWVSLTYVLFPVRFRLNSAARGRLAALSAELGPVTKAEARTAVVFIVVVGAWLFQAPLRSLPGFSGLTDAGVAMAGALALFLIPSGEKGRSLVGWEDARALPWDVLVLFGGGLSLAAAVSDSGLAAWAGGGLALLGAFGLVALVIGATALVVYLTELTSNLATAATMLPVVAAIAVETGVPPLTLIVPVTLAASCAFMLPVATPPNAIVFSSGRLSIPQMMKAGFVLNLIGTAVLSIVAVVVAPRVFG